MNRRGQIFLILTILVVSFLIGITSVLIDIRRADYIDPAPDSDETLAMWDLTKTSLVQIMDVKLTESTIQSIANGPVDITEQITNLELYLAERGISATIVNNTPIVYTQTNSGTSDTTATIDGSFYIYLKSGNTEINQNLTINLQYRANSQNAGELLLTKTLTTELEYIAGATFDTSGLTDLQNGLYTYGPGLTGITVQVTFPNSLILSCQLT